ncbi:MAG: aldehyde dehydrogenase EutE, partial [Acetivibrio sp.]
GDHPFVLVEQLMPVLPIVRCRTFEEAVEGAYIAESGNRHTASMFSKNVDNMTQFARKIETTIFVKNGATLKGIGIGGNGHTTMTIAGPTGEGITCAKSFTRRRRCMLADGGFRII